MNSKTLALYLGCRIYTPKGIHQLIGVCEALSSREIRIQTIAVNGVVNWFDEDETKPLLRPLSSMSEDEAVEWYAKKDGANHTQGFLFLLSKGFDLFGLIEKGEALDIANY